jgi:hypothetical protein
MLYGDGLESQGFSFFTAVKISTTRTLIFSIMGSILTNEMAISILENVVKNYEMVITSWKDASLETKDYLIKEKTKIEARLNELREEELKK